MLASIAPRAKTPSLVPLERHPWSRQPFTHQRDAHGICAKKSRFALLAEQGTGKTAIMINVLAWHHLNGRIVRVLVVAPLSVIPSWNSPTYGELGKCCPVPFRSYWLKGDKKKKGKLLDKVRSAAPGALHVTFVNYESVISGEKELASVPWDAIVLDESHRIKNPFAKTTKALLRVGEGVRFKYVMTGTPMTHSPLDYYSQFRFLAPEIIGYQNFTAFRKWVVAKENYFGQPEEWKNLDDLASLIRPYSFRVLKKDCLDLPDKLYSSRVVTLSAEQRDAYDQLRSQFVVELTRGDGTTDVLEAPQLLARLTRLLQITGGFLPTDDGPVRPLENAKMKALLEVLEDAGNPQAVIWCNFVDEIRAVVETLNATHGEGTAVAFYGDVPIKRRAEIIEGFQAGKIRFFVGQAASGGTGITLTAASLCVYFSNGYRWGDRVQSEDRLHRIGQVNHVSYVDLLAFDTVDEDVRLNLDAKTDLAESLNRGALVNMLTRARKAGGDEVDPVSLEAST